MKILAGVLVAAATVAADPSFGWNRTVQPPRSGLPAVEVSLGYPEGYLPRFSPIELRRTGAFDGMIGYHFEVEGKQTSDTPRATRAARLFNVLTLAESNVARREVVIDWRDRAGRLLASANAGVPPWSVELKHLRVGGAPARYLGASEESVVLSTSQLQARPEWYRGWLGIVLPAEDWLSLDAKVKNAILQSGTSVITFGVPAARALSPIDEAVLPVSFTPDGARAKPGADWLRGANGPRLVGRGDMTWAATEDDLREAPPRLRSRHIHSWDAQLKVKWTAATIAAIAAEARPLVALAAAAVMSLLLWLLSRRGGAVVAGVIAVLLIAAHPLYRDVIRPRTMQSTTEDWSRAENGTYWRDRTLSAYGPAPLRMREPQPVGALLRTDPPAAHAELAADGQVLTVAYGRPWPAAVLKSGHAELWDGIRVGVADVSNDSLTFDYDLPFEAVRVTANWTRGGKFAIAAKQLPGTRRGRATLKRNEIIGIDRWGHYFGERISRHGGTDGVRLIFGVRDGHRFTWRGDVPAAGFVPYRMTAPLRRRNDGRWVAEMVIPEGGIPKKGQVTLVTLATFADVLAGATIEGEGGRLTLAPPRRDRPYRFTAEELRRIAREHGLLTITSHAKVEPRHLDAASVEMTVRESRQ